MDVVAVVAVVGDRLAASSRQPPSAPRLRICAAGIVEVVLARDALAAGLQDPTQQVADERAPGVADVERAGRVGRHELDIDRAWPGRRHATPAGGSARIAATDGLQDGVAQAQVQEARRRDVGRGDRRCVGIGRRFGDELRRREPRRSRAAPSGRVGRASSPGCWRSRRGRVGRTFHLDRRADRVIRPGRQPAAGHCPVPGT